MTITKPTGERTLWQELRTAGARLALPFLAVGTVVVLLGLFLTKVLDDTAAADTDVALSKWFADGRTEWLNTVTHYGTLFGETPVIVALTALTAGIFRAVFHRWRESVLLVCCVTGQALIFLVTTILIDRNRPRVPHLDDSPPTSSFPSGHTAATTAFYLGAALIIAWHTRDTWIGWVVLGIGLFIPLMMATCRMYRGMHYTTDVTTSLILGVTLLTLALKLMPLGEGHERSRTRARVAA